MSSAPFQTQRKQVGFRQQLTRFAVGMAMLSQLMSASARPEPGTPAELQQELRSLHELGSVLYVAAHPDDENNQLIGYLARGRGYRTAYLSATRGDGGQNVIGSEFGQTLGLIRTYELLAARREDGGRQYFTRAIDFGFSKDAAETLRIWDREQVLSDMVRVIRTFRPDVMVTRFSPIPGGTHGHHTSSAILALEAFKLAGDPKAFPEQLGELKPWQPKRIFQNGGGFGPRGGGGDNNALRMEIDDKEAPEGLTFGGISGKARSMHKSQGMGGAGGGGGRGTRAESFTLMAGDPATKDIMDGIDTTWARVPNGAEIGKLLEEVLAKFDVKDPWASAPALLKIRSRLATLAPDTVVDEKRQQLDQVLMGCLGLSFESVVANAEIVPGEQFKLEHHVTVRSGLPIRWLGVRQAKSKMFLGKPVDLGPTQAEARTSEMVLLPESTRMSQPYWLRSEHPTGIFQVDDPNLIGTPENQPILPLEQVFEVSGQTLVFPDQPVQLITSKKGTIRRRLEAIPPVSLKFEAEVQLFSPGKTRQITVHATAARAATKGSIHLKAPEGWLVSPTTDASPAAEFSFKQAGDQAQCTFNVTPPKTPSIGELKASITVGGKTYDTQRTEVHYDHIPPLLLQPAARLKGVCLDLIVHGRKVGYLPGAGDSVADCLQQMGYEVTQLKAEDLTPEKLNGLDAVVVGIRLFDVHRDLNLDGLFKFAEQGGNVVMQYNRADGLLETPLTLKISQARVTDETAPVTFLAPEHPVLNTPNKINNEDFNLWIQERGVYFPSQWDAKFTPILASHDPGEQPLKSGLLVADYGKGHFIYTGLAFFRQLPEGVPGAYRLFANLVSLGK